MICADTSSMMALLGGEQGQDVNLVRNALADRSLVLAPAVVSELLSDRELPAAIEPYVLDTPQLEVKPGYWERAGKLRARMQRHHSRAKLADALIAQSCLDHGVLLVTRDRDFTSFQKLAGLRLLAGPSRVP